MSARTEVEAILNVVQARLTGAPADFEDWDVIVKQLVAATRLARKECLFHLHREEDPHCTCNDCIEHFTRESR